MMMVDLPRAGEDFPANANMCHKTKQMNKILPRKVSILRYVLDICDN